MKEPTIIKGVVAFPNENGNRDIRFIDAFYNDLFKIPDHSNIVITYLDGTKRVAPCEYIDDTHTDIGGTAYHICQFAELMMQNGATYAPEHPEPEPSYGTYEIYQLARPVRYSYSGYDYAEKQLNPHDYKCEYAYVLPKNLSLEDLFSRHNSDARPFSMRMRSMSVSDVVVLNRGGKREAFYVDNIGFKKVDQFLQKKPRKIERGEAR